MSLAVERATETALEVAADLKMPEHIMQLDTNKLLRDTYVDDGTTGGSPGYISGLMRHKHYNRVLIRTIQMGATARSNGDHPKVQHLHQEQLSTKCCQAASPRCILQWIDAGILHSALCSVDGEC